MTKIGDTVRFLNSTGGGRVVRIKDNIAYVEDTDGFEMPVLLKECVVVAAAGSAMMGGTAAQGKAPSKEVTAPSAVFVQPEPEVEEVEETPEGEKLNVVLGFEPREIKHLNTTTYDAYLVNDSNYYLYFTYMTRGDGDAGWTVRHAGIVEPSIQVHLTEVAREDLPAMDRIGVQYIAFKQGREFQLKTPSMVEYRLDTTKFFKLHCFHDNPYFDTPVIAFDIVKNDVPQRMKTVDSSALEDAMRQKKAVDRPAKRPVLKRSEKRNNEIIEVDLHIHELIDSVKGLSPADMLNLQVDEFRRVMDANLKNHGQKIVFIHGKGEGVLRQSLMKELAHRYKGHDVQDASFREYGYGATQVTIR